MFYSRRFSSLNQYGFSSAGRSLNYFVNSSCVTALSSFTVYALTLTFVDRTFTCRPFIAIFGLQRSMLVSYFLAVDTVNRTPQETKLERSRVIRPKSVPSLWWLTWIFHLPLIVSIAQNDFKVAMVYISVKQQTINVHALNTQCALLEVLTDIRNRVSHQLRQ